MSGDIKKNRNLSKPLAESKFDSIKKKIKKNIKPAVKTIKTHLKKGTPVPKTGIKIVDDYTKDSNIKGYGKSLRIVNRKTGKKDKTKTKIAKGLYKGYKAARKIKKLLTY
tara:strand:- start:4431 stop:4760 length:330 start_codon:yes stop_codon:yes gene_type:complete